MKNSAKHLGFSIDNNRLSNVSNFWKAQIKKFTSLTKRIHDLSLTVKARNLLFNVLITARYTYYASILLISVKIIMKLGSLQRAAL
jgi:hypothetical protein